MWSILSPILQVSVALSMIRTSVLSSALTIFYDLESMAHSNEKQRKETGKG